MKPRLYILLLIVSILLSSCNNPEELGPWPDTATLWVGSGAYPDTALAWSPFGSVLLFTSSGNVGSPCIFGFAGTGTPAMRTFTSFDEFTGPWGCWSDSMGMIAYAAVHEDGSSELRTIPGNGTAVEVLLYDSLPHMYPGWNPEGDSLVFCTEIGGLWSLWTAAYEDFEPIPLYEPSADCLRPSYSPDGSWILFQYRIGDASDIWLIRPDGSDAHAVQSGSSDDIHPSWGPYQNWFVFSSDRSGNYEIWIYNFDTDELVQVTDDPGVDIYPSWNPSHEWIAFSSDRHSGEGSYDIFSIHEPDTEY